MAKNQITRKEFLTKTLSGIAGIRIISDILSCPNISTYRNIGQTGILVTPLCFGANRTIDTSLIRYGIYKGINFIDTGHTYANGNNERIVGQSVTESETKVVIQSKIRLDADELPSEGRGRKGSSEIRESLNYKLEQVLAALKSDYLDILLYHDASEEKYLFHDEVLKFFAEKKSLGLIKACGFSSNSDNLNLIDRNNSEVFYDVIMTPFNHNGSYGLQQASSSEWYQDKLISSLTVAANKGIGIVAMKSCSGGKYSPSYDVKPSYREAVKWVLDHKFISSAMIAFSSFEHIDEFTDLLII